MDGYLDIFGKNSWIQRCSKGKLGQTCSPALSVCSGHCNKMPQIGWLINTVQEAGTLRWGSPHGQVRADGVADFSLCPHTAGARELSWNSFIRALILSRRAPPSWPNYIPMAPPPKSIPLEGRVSTLNSSIRCLTPQSCYVSQQNSA